MKNMKKILALVVVGTTIIACGTDFGNTTGTVRVNKHGVDVNIDVPVDDSGTDGVKWPDQDCLWTPTLVCCESGCVGISDGDDSGSSNSDSGFVDDSGLNAEIDGAEIDGNVSENGFDSGTDSSVDAVSGSSDSTVGDSSDVPDCSSSRDSGSREKDAALKCTVPVQVFRNHGDCVSYCAHTYLKGNLRHHELFVTCKNDCDCAY